MSSLECPIERKDKNEKENFNSNSIDFFGNGTKIIGKKFLGTQRNAIFHRENLQNHNKNPNTPKEMKNRETGEEVHSF